jgi:hypothetical protein
MSFTLDVEGKKQENQAILWPITMAYTRILMEILVDKTLEKVVLLWPTLAKHLPWQERGNTEMNKIGLALPLERSVHWVGRAVCEWANTCVCWLGRGHAYEDKSHGDVIESRGRCHSEIMGQEGELCAGLWMTIRWQEELVYGEEKESFKKRGLQMWRHWGRLYPKTERRSGGGSMGVG